MEWDKFEMACQLLATKDEICGLLNVSDATLQRRIKEKYNDTFEGVLKRFGSTAKVSLRRYQFNLAKTNTAMCIWLGKQYLNQKEPDQQMQEIPLGLPEFKNISNEELKAKVEEKLKKYSQLQTKT